MATVKANTNLEGIDSDWLALMIGNSRLHWAWFSNSQLKQAWDIPHLSSSTIAQLVQNLDWTAIESVSLNQAQQFLLAVPKHLPLWVASVISAQVPLWQAYHQTQVIDLTQIPISGLYSSLGIDRALALLGASQIYGLPSLVVDGGTALTFSGIDAQNQLVGGAILPGLQLQLQALATTAALPLLTRPAVLPDRWATHTDDAIGSGVIYGLVASVRDFLIAWRQEFPTGAIVFTGGDGAWLAQLLDRFDPSLAKQIKVEPQLIFAGMNHVRASELRKLNR